MECSDGQLGYGKRKRSIPTLPADPNKIFEITITSFIKVNYDDDSENFEQILKNQTKQQQNKKQLIYGNQNDEQDNRLRTSKNLEDRQTRGKALITEETQFTAIVAESSSNKLQLQLFTSIVLLFAYLY